MKKNVLKLALLFGIIIFFIIVNKCISNKKINGPYVGENEFLATIECTDIFDYYQSDKYKISFELKSNTGGKVDVTTYSVDYSPKYIFHENIDATTEYEKYEIIVSPYVVDSDDSQTFLAFYSTYGTGVVVEVKNIEIMKIR